jgi:pimeloyl-ACP methyl ester carboxylesterase
MRTEPVLLVHGFASSFDLNWRRNGWADLLADAKREVIAVDLLGHGTADKPHDPAAYTDLEQCVLDVLPADGRVVDAVGFSLGAVTLLRAVGRAPERFGRIVVGGIGQQNMTAGDSEETARAIEAGLDALGDSDGEETRLARAFAQFAANGSNDPKALAACLRRPAKPLTVEDLALVPNPTLVVIGDKDFVGSAQPIVDGLADARLVVLRNADHFGTPQHFGFLDAALEFLDAMPG